MASKSDTGGSLVCSFCGKSQKEVKKLIAGPTVYICDECIALCNDIIAEEFEAEETESHPAIKVPKPSEFAVNSGTSKLVRTNFVRKY